MEKAFSFFAKRGATGMMLPEWLPTWENLEFGAAVSQLDKVVLGIIAKRRAEGAAAGIGGSGVAGSAGRNGNGAGGATGMVRSSEWGSDAASSSGGATPAAASAATAAAAAAAVAASTTAAAPARTDLLQSLLDARDDDGSGMDDNSLRDELMTLLVAGKGLAPRLCVRACAPRLCIA